MSLYPIYIDSSIAGAQLSIGTTNTSTIIIGAPTTSIKNTSTVINGVRLDSNKNASNIIITFANSSITPINGINNTIISDGLANTTGSYNTALGSGALLANTTGNNNTAIGYTALSKNLTTSYNTAVGFNALQYSTTGANTAIGNGALAGSGYTGHTNTAVGVNTLVSLTNGTLNTAIGAYADGFSTTGSNNTCVGWTALSSGTNGTAASNSTAIGYSATTNGYSNSTALGANAACTAANQIVIGTTGQTTQIGNSRITNSTNFGTIYVSTNWKNNVQTAPTSYQGDMIITTGDTYDTSITTGLTAYARPLIINGSDISYEPGGGSNPGSYPQNIGRAGDVIIRAGGASSNSNNGTAYQSLIGGNVYIDGGGGYCGGGYGNAVNVTQGSIIFRTGAQKSGNTYYGNGTQTAALMTISASQITASITTSGFSDIRMKKNIEEIKIEDGLNFMKNKEIFFERKDESKKQSGYLAQDLIKNGFEHLIYSSDYEELEETVDSDGFISPKGKMYSLNYSGVTPYHGVVIKHLLKENEELKNEQKIQQDKITSLESKVEVLQKQMADILQRLN